MTNFQFLHPEFKPLLEPVIRACRQNRSGARTTSRFVVNGWGSKSFVVNDWANVDDKPVRRIIVILKSSCRA